MTTLFEELLENYERENPLKRIYRFQGGNSIEKIKVIDNKLIYDEFSYVYFSRSLKHHKYFVSKRLKQFINDEILKNQELKISKKHLNNSDSFKILEQMVQNSSKILGLQSLEICVHPYFLNIMKRNLLNPHMKNYFNQNRMVEIVDKRKYGGGFGLCEDWLELLGYFTFFVKSREFKSSHLDLFLKNLKRNVNYDNSCRKIENINFLEEMNYSICFNESVFNPFTKYKIMNCMEQIYNKGLYIKDSSFDKEPRTLLKEGLDVYEDSRQKCLTLLPKLSQKRII